MKRAKLPTLHSRRLQAIAIIMYKVKFKTVWRHLTLRTYLWLFPVLRIILEIADFTISRLRTVAYGKHSLTYLGPVIWSKLDRSIRSSESLDIFKKHIKLVNLTSLLDSTGKDFFLRNKYCVTHCLFYIFLILTNVHMYISFLLIIYH